MPGYRKTVGRVYEETVGERLLPAPGWTLVEIKARGRVVFVVNIRGSEIILHRFHPGGWELGFGVDMGVMRLVSIRWRSHPQGRPAGTG